MLDIADIKSKVRKLAFYDMEYQSFGSWGHAHIFKPVLDEAELVAWEDSMQIRLPEDYRSYLIKLGNGGAGPAYGIAPFRLPLKEYLKEASIYSDSQVELFNKTAKAWFDLESQDENDLYEQFKLDHPQEANLSFSEWEDKFFDTDFDALEQKLMNNGQLFIANQGCSVDICLILNGSERGRCHCTNIDYDYSYPCTSEQRKQFNLLQEPRPNRSVVWAEYKESLTDFDQYMMGYLKAALEQVDNFSKEQQQQFQREREQVLEFEQAFNEQDLLGIDKQLEKLDPLALSLKTRSYLIERLTQLTKEHPNDTLLPRFLGQLETNRSRISSSVVFSHKSLNNTDYPHPSFEEFLSTFNKSFLENDAFIC